MRPVIRMVGSDPVVMYKGKEKRLRIEPIYVLDRATAYVENHIEFSKKSLASQSSRWISYTKGTGVDTDIAPFGGDYGISIFRAVIQAQQAVKGGFAAIVIYSDENLTKPASRFNRTEIIVRELPDIPAGQDIEIKLKGAVMDGGLKPRYFIQLFDQNGLEIPSNVMTHAWRYYALRDLEQLRHILPDYLKKNRGASRGVTPVVMPKPFLPKDTSPPETPISAIIDISAKGQVSHVDISGLEQGPLHTAITDALEGWLFLPQLKNGNPTATKVQVPIQF